MPYSKVEGHDECDDGQIAVVKDGDGEVMGCHASEDDADEQIAAIEAGEQSTEKEIHLSVGGPNVIIERDSSPDNTTDQHVPQELQTLRSRAQSGERVPAHFETRRTASLDATDGRLETINTQHSDIELQPEDVEVFRDFAVHDLGPRDGMRRPLQFTTGALQKLAQDFQAGRTMNVHHNGERQVGTTFGAEVLRREEVRGVEANWLAVDWYAPTVDASEQRLQDIADMQTGVLRYTSIEFAGGDWQESELEMDGETQFFFRIDTNGTSTFRDRLEAEGIARVGLGAVRGAGAS